MQALAWVFPVLNRPEKQQYIQRLKVDATVGKPALTAPLPAGRQGMGHGQPGLPAIEIDGLAQQQPGHLPAEEQQMTLIENRTVLSKKASELTVEPGVRIHKRLDWCDNPNLSWLPAHPIG
jgi:hypothetical protein